MLPVGNPSLDVTEKIVYAMDEAGANLRALSGGVTTDKVFDMVEKIRKSTSIPMVFMTYANVVFLTEWSVFVKKQRKWEWTE